MLLMRSENLKIQSDQIAFDIDGVFADTFRVFVETARKEFGVLFDYEDITQYDFRSVIDIDEEISEHIIQRILDDPIGMGIQPMSGAVDVLGRLLQNHPVLFVTARTQRAPILQWIQRQLYFCNQKAINLVATGTHREKLPILLDHEIRYFVEDRLETCYLLRKVAVTPIVYEQPWNRKPHPFPTVKTWEEIAAMIDW
jgi:uncharacterized HAD superfamily protein